MEKFQYLIDTTSWFLPIIIVLMIWDVVWKMIAMWKAARNNHIGWFISIAIFNTIGVLPIFYLFTHRGRSKD